MIRALIAVASVALSSAGCADTLEGARCDPDVPPPSVEVGDTFLGCVGPPGCDPGIEYTYQWFHAGADPGVCGCDQGIHEFALGRWRYYGPCEHCDSVEYNRDAHRFELVGVWGNLQPVSPTCTLCDDARTDTGGACTGADGTPRASDCCRCVLDVSGACIRAITGAPANPECCR